MWLAIHSPDDLSTPKAMHISVAVLKTPVKMSKFKEGKDRPDKQMKPRRNEFVHIARKNESIDQALPCKLPV